MMRQFIASLLIATFLASPAMAAKAPAKQEPTADESIASTDPDSLPILQKIKGSKKDLSYDYLGKRYGMDAWLLTGPEVMQVVYTSKNMQGALIGGALVGMDGKEVTSDMTKEFMQQYPERAQEILATVRKQLPIAQTPGKEKSDKPSSSSELLWQKLQQSGNITFGSNKAAPEVYAFLDPATPATKDVWKHLGPVAKANNITLHILPLAVTTADSIMEIAMTLGDPDQKAAWERLMAGQSNIKGPTPEGSGILGMKANVDIAQGLNLHDLPFFVYRDKAGKIRVLQGAPKDWSLFTK